MSPTGGPSVTARRRTTRIADVPTMNSAKGAMRNAKGRRSCAARSENIGTTSVHAISVATRYSEQSMAMRLSDRTRRSCNPPGPVTRGARVQCSTAYNVKSSPVHETTPSKSPLNTPARDFDVQSSGLPARFQCVGNLAGTFLPVPADIGSGREQDEKGANLSDEPARQAGTLAEVGFAE